MIIEPTFCPVRVDIRGIVNALLQGDININKLARILEVADKTVYDWKYGKCRPRSLFKMYLLIDFACRFLSDSALNSFGVYEWS